MAPISNALAQVRPDDAAYLRLAQQEASFWAAQDRGLLEAVEIRGDTPIERYTNRRFTGEETTAWYETIAKRGSFKRGLALGTSALGQDARILETNPKVHMTFCDIATGSLERWQRALAPRFPGRVDTVTADLNFVDLPENAYDLIVSSSTLHHVINLEHLASQINRSLTPDGIFVLQDYVGESKFLFTDEKKRVFETLYDRDIGRQPGRKPGLVWLNEDRDRFSPFCGIRSGDTLAVLTANLALQELHTAGCVAGLMLYAQPAHPLPQNRTLHFFRRVRNRAMRSLPFHKRTALAVGGQYLSELLLVDEILSDANALVPFNAFAVYGKR